MAFEERRLVRRWVHAHEEDTPENRVFLPDDRPLPPSRGRTRYEFRAGGILIKSSPGPTDRGASLEGIWKHDRRGRVTISLPGCPDETLEIVSLDEDRLVVKR